MGVRVRISYPYQLFLSHENPKAAGITRWDELESEGLNGVRAAAAFGDSKALRKLEAYARKKARTCARDLKQRGIDIPRFVQYGLQNGDFQKTVSYTVIEWDKYKQAFIDELVKYMPQPHNICVKGPDDKPSPPFADICATYLADYWDILEGLKGNTVPEKRHVYARHAQAF